MADENESVTQLEKAGFFSTSQAYAADIFRRVQQALEQTIYIVMYVLNPVVNVFVAIAEIIHLSYSTIRTFLKFLTSYLHIAVNFDYGLLAKSLLGIPAALLLRIKKQVRENLWKPVDKSLRFLARRLWIRLRKLGVYWRGLVELSRRIFLLTSDYVPGGKWTVGIALGFLSFLLVTRLLAYFGAFLQLVTFAFNIVLLLLNPLILMLKDVLAVASHVLSIALVGLRGIFSVILAATQKVLHFVGINVAAIFAGVYRFWRGFVTSEPVQLLCTLLMSLLFTSLDTVLFSIVPFVSRTIIYVGANIIQICIIAYNKLIAVSVDHSYTGEYHTVTTISTGFLILYALWTAFRLRNSFPPSLWATEDGYESIKSEVCVKKVSFKKTTPAAATQRSSRHVGRKEQSKAEEEKAGVYIHTSSMDHICSSFIRGNCQRGRLCDGHHCHTTYHWQYRSTQGWKSFSDEENHVIERLYCDPGNDVEKTNDVEVVLTSYTSRYATQAAEEPVKLDFESMKIEKNYRRADLRRLSTDSYVKAGDATMATIWDWYWQDEDMGWRKYGEGDPNENGPKQEEIEKAFLQKERCYNFNTNGQDYRLYFYMKPMCERSTSSRSYSKRIIRRRPRAREEPVKQAAIVLSFWQKWSPMRVFTWR